MRILLVNSIFWGGGVDSQTADLAQGLAQCGDSEVHIAVGPGRPLTERIRALPGAQIHELPDHRVKWVLRLAGLMRREKVQIAHAQHGRDYWTTVLAALLSGAGTRVVVSRHLMTPLTWHSRHFLLRAADVACVSKAVHGVVAQHIRGPRSRLHTVYGGIDLERFRPRSDAAVLATRQAFGWDDAAVVFGIVGFFNLPEGKGQLLLLEAAAALRERCPKARFVLAGAGTLESRLREKVHSLELEPIARILPFSRDVPTLMNALDVLVHPAIGTEALGIVLWEAMACGKPVIASRLDGIPEAFNDGQHGLLIPPRDVPALAGAIERLADDPALRERFGLAAREYVAANCGVRQYGERMLLLYQEILSRR